MQERCGLSLPTYFLADEKLSHCLTATVCLPTIVRGRVIWHLGYTEEARAAAFTQSYSLFQCAAFHQELAYRVRGILTAARASRGPPVVVLPVHHGPEAIPQPQLAEVDVQDELGLTPVLPVVVALPRDGAVASIIALTTPSVRRQTAVTPAVFSLFNGR